MCGGVSQKGEETELPLVRVVMMKFICMLRLLDEPVTLLPAVVSEFMKLTDNGCTYVGG